MNCNNIIDLGCFGSCSNIATSIIATETGTYTYLISFLKSKMKNEAILSIGDELIINQVLNESHTYTMMLTSPSGNVTCYKFKTFIER